MKSTNHVEFHELLSHADSMGFGWNNACDFLDFARPQYEIHSKDFSDGQFWVEEVVYDDEDPEYNAFSEKADDDEHKGDFWYKPTIIKESFPGGKVIRYGSSDYEVSKEAIQVMVSFFKTHGVSEITVTA